LIEWEYNDLLGKISDTELAKICGESYGRVRRRRIKLGIPFFKKVSVPRNGYKIDCFREIDDESAYWLGFMFADGCVCKTTKNRSIVNLSNDVREALVEFCNFVDAPLTMIRENVREDGRIGYVVSLCNKSLANDLINLGCVPKKSNILSAPKIKRKFFESFLLGFFDGDGSISLNRSINQWKVSIGTGGGLLAKWIMSYLDSISLIYGHEVKGDFHSVVMVGLSGKCFLERLYDNNKGYCIEYKKHRFDLMKDLKFKSPNMQEWEIEYVKNIENFKSIGSCIEAMSNDERNFGWTRCARTIRDYRKRLQAA